MNRENRRRSFLAQNTPVISVTLRKISQLHSFYFSQHVFSLCPMYPMLATRGCWLFLNTHQAHASFSPAHGSLLLAGMFFPQITEWQDPSN
jgi:hypothetical protein